MASLSTMKTAAFVAFALAPVALAADFQVSVGISQTSGQVGMGYDPDRILPAVGDTITFTWAIPSYISNSTAVSHSVTQSSATTPCQPLGGGFDSGAFMTAPESAGMAKTITLSVNNTDALYFYSSVGSDCSQGMALGVNTPATGDGSIDSYIQRATGGAGPSNGPNSTSITASTSASMSSSGSASRTSSSSSSASISTTASASGAGKIVFVSAGAVVSGVFAACFGIAL